MNIINSRPNRMQQQTYRSVFKRALFYFFVRPIWIVAGTQWINAQLQRNEAQLQGIDTQQQRNEAQIQGIEVQLQRNEAQIQGIEVQLQRNEAQIQGIDTQLRKNQADLEDNLERALAKTINARLDAIQNRSAGLQATLSATLQRPMQECLDDVVRNVVGPLVSAAVQNEMNNISLQVDRLIRLNAPLILPSLTSGHENYQSMVRAFLCRLKPSAARGSSKKSLNVPGLPSVVVVSTEPRQIALLAVVPCTGLVSSDPSIARAHTNETSEAVAWTEHPSHRVATIPADVTMKVLNEALRHSEEKNCEPILYIDLSGDELNFIDRVSQDILSKFNQLVVVLYETSNLHAANFLQAASKILDKIESNFSCVHIHARNTGGLCSVQNMAIPNIIEMTYANKKKFKFTDTSEVYPTAIDVPTASNMADIYLGNFIF